VSRILASIEEAIARAGSPAALARQLGVSEVHMGRVRRGDSGISVETAAALADVLDSPDPLRVLEDAGHKDFAELLRKMFGTPGRDKLTKSQRELLKDVADIDPADWKSLRAIIRRMAEDARKR
jgi:hypothetical protein